MTRKSLLIALILVAVSPVFGVILAELTGYHEPLNIAADLLGLRDLTEQFNWTPFLDYTVPGLPEIAGYIVASLIGVIITIGLGLALSRILGSK